MSDSYRACLLTAPNLAPTMDRLWEPAEAVRAAPRALRGERERQFGLSVTQKTRHWQLAAGEQLVTSRNIKTFPQNAVEPPPQHYCVSTRRLGGCHANPKAAQAVIRSFSGLDSSKHKLRQRPSFLAFSDTNSFQLGFVRQTVANPIQEFAYR